MPLASESERFALAGLGATDIVEPLEEPDPELEFLPPFVHSSTRGA